MKLKEIAEAEETYKKESGFIYHPGSIWSLGSRDDDEPEGEEKESGVTEERCKRCDEKLEEGAEFCGNCGTKVHQK